MRRLRVLSEHPHLGKPNDERDAFEGAQAYVDAGLAEWIAPARSERVETTEAVLPIETAVTRSTPRGRGRRPSRPALPAD